MFTDHSKAVASACCGIFFSVIVCLCMYMLVLFSLVLLAFCLLCFDCGAVALSAPFFLFVVSTEGVR